MNTQRASVLLAWLRLVMLTMCALGWQPARAADEFLEPEKAFRFDARALDDPEVARRFRAEAITVARLSHPGIATIYELFQHDGQWLMVMEFVRGDTLEQLIARGGPLPADRAAAYWPEYVARWLRWNHVRTAAALAAAALFVASLAHD